MDLGEIWAEHKRFIVAAGAALIVVFIATRILTAMYVRPTDRLELNTRRLSARLRTRPSPTSANINQQRELARDMDERLGKLEERVRFNLDPAFVLQPGSDFDLAYNDRFRDVRDRIMERAAIEDVVVDPSLGMPDSTPTDRAEVQRILKALDLIGRVLDMAMDAGVEAIPRIRVPNVGRKGFLAGKKYLSAVRAELELQGSADSILELVQSLQGGGAYISLAGCRLEQLDPKNPGPVRAELELVGLEIDPESPARQAESQERGRRTRRR